MDIALYIAELLHQYNEINIVGLGTFFKKRVSGFYDDRNHVFIPPTHYLAFKLDHHESLILADYCCTQRNISQTTAIYFIEKFVNSIWKQLNTSGYADLKALGILKKTDTGYTLEAKEKTGYKHTFYGLKPVSETQISHYSQIIDELAPPTHNVFAPSEAHVDEYKQQEDLTREITQQEVIIPHHTIIPTEKEERINQYKQQQNITKEIPEREGISPLPFIISTEPEERIHQYKQQKDVSKEIPERESIHPLPFIISTEPEERIHQYKQQKDVSKEISERESIIPQAFIVPPEKTESPSLIIEAKDASNEEKRKPLAEAILAFISLILLATIGIYYFYPDVYSHFSKLFPIEQPIVASTSKQVEPLADSTIKINPIDTLQKRETESINQHDTTKTNNINTQAFTNDQTRYEIIVATFGKQSEAEDYVIRLKQKGVIVKISDHTPGSRTRVSYASFTNKQIAETTLIQIRKDISPDAWMAIINPKKP